MRICRPPASSSNFSALSPHSDVVTVRNAKPLHSPVFSSVTTFNLSNSSSFTPLSELAAASSARLRLFSVMPGGRLEINSSHFALSLDLLLLTRHGPHRPCPHRYLHTLPPRPCVRRHSPRNTCARVSARLRHRLTPPGSLRTETASCSAAAPVAFTCPSGPWA